MPEFNFIVKNEHIQPGDKELFFGDENVTFIEPDKNWFDILILCGIFQSKTQVRNNWNTFKEKFKSEKGTLPEGFIDVKDIGKLRHRITLLVPLKPSHNG
jgi:hypothetical protein